MKKIVVIGGGTGSFNVLSALRDHNFEISSIVNMADNGGSSGILKDELGVLPPGDIRQCLVALADSSHALRELFTHRFKKGGLKGHTLGNLFLAACEDLSGSFEKAVAMAGDVLKIQGKVIPVALKKIELCLDLKDGERIEGEFTIGHHKLLQKKGIKRIFLKPGVLANPKAISAIMQADLVIVAPGNIYGSIIPALLVRGIPEAIARSRAKVLYVVNLMSKKGQTEGFCAHKFVEELERWSKRTLFDMVLYNTKKPPASLLNKYRKEGSYINFDGAGCETGRALEKTRKKVIKFIGTPLWSQKLFFPKKGDPLASTRTLIRHDKNLLANAIMNLI